MADKIAAKTYVIFSDVHVPYQNRPFVSAALELVKDLNPHGMILLGDILDVPEVSRHNRGSLALLEGKRISHTFDAGNEFLDQIEKSLGPRCKERHFLEGNHEFRIQSWINLGDNGVFAGDEMVSIDKRLGLKKRGYVYHDGYPKKARMRIGKLLLFHGKKCGDHPAKANAVQFQTSILTGHVHTQQVYCSSTWDGQRISACQGMMADRDSEAMDYGEDPSRWIDGFSVVMVRESGDFFIQFVNFVNGALFFGSQIYPKALRRS